MKIKKGEKQDNPNTKKERKKQIKATIFSHQCIICNKNINFSGKKPDICGARNCIDKFWNLRIAEV